jgi:choline dehydrogenase-like flavoprotein
VNNDDWMQFWASPEGRSEVGFRTKEYLPPTVQSELPVVDIVPARVDAVVIGAGAGGGVAAERLARSGRSVLIVERGRWLSFDDIGRSHLVNQRVAYGGLSAGPVDGNPRVVEDAQGNTTMVPPWDSRYHANAATIGGGTRVYGAQAWRFHPTDFEMASTYGVPEDSTLADWPVRYVDLAQFYDRIEHELGVAGRAQSMVHLPPFSRDYPMPPVAEVERTVILKQAANSLGWPTLPPPLAINTLPRDGRPACIECGYCVGFACPTDAKNGSHNTFLLRAISTGNASILANATATRVNLVSGRATSVQLVHDGRAFEVATDLVVCSAGAIESARLLLLSGLEHPALGRNLQGHVYVSAFARMEHSVRDNTGPGPSIATSRWLHGNDGIVGGGMLLDDFVTLPTAFWQATADRPRPTERQAGTDWMRTYYRNTIDIKGPIQEVPTWHARVTIDPSVRDVVGMPVARLSGATHPESIRAAAFLRDRAVEWLHATGALEVWGQTADEPYLSGGQHQAGTCRMGDDPANSVVDASCRVHGIENLYVADTSVHVTNGGVNPFLTAMALADRTAQGIIAES